jgi:hypothetical protein
MSVNSLPTTDDEFIGSFSYANYSFIRCAYFIDTRRKQRYAIQISIYSCHYFQAMSSTEDKAYEIMRELDVDYVLVIFGGLIGYSSDDINKFLWMVRIGGSTDTGAHIKESDYFTPQGEFRVDKEGSPTLLNCLMYKLSYYRFGETYTEQGMCQSSKTDRLLLSIENNVL